MADFYKFVKVLICKRFNLHQQQRMIIIRKDANISKIIHLYSQFTGNIGFNKCNMSIDEKKTKQIFPPKANV